MTDQAVLERLDTAVDILDRAMAGRPEIFTSPVGFALGTIVSVARQDPESILRALEWAKRALDVLDQYLAGEIGPEALFLVMQAMAASQGKPSA